MPQIYTCSAPNLLTCKALSYLIKRVVHESAILSPWVLPHYTATRYRVCASLKMQALQHPPRPALQEHVSREWLLYAVVSLLRLILPCKSRGLSFQAVVKQWLSVSYACRLAIASPAASESAVQESRPPLSFIALVCS